MTTGTPFAGDLIIETRGLTKRYDGITAIDNVDLAIRRGEVFGIIGPNGAGKSTLVGMIGGELSPSAGRVFYGGVDITRLPAADRARHGIGRTYQIPRPFLDMTVAENLQVPLYAVNPLISGRQAEAMVEANLLRTGLAGEANTVARNLPLLRRKRLEVARALMLDPQVLLLDEVGAGLVDAEVSELIDLIHSIADGRTSIVIVEHVIRIVRECCRSVAVIHVGTKFAEGATNEVLADKEVAAIYLGTAHDGYEAEARPRASLVASGELAPRRDVLLRLDGVTAGYGQARVLDRIDLEVKAGEAVAILGTNGAGKTTLANTICGTVGVTGGAIHFGGDDITTLPSHLRTIRGIAHCMEGRRIFSTLSVEENLLIAARGVAAAEQRRRLDRIFDLFPILHERRDNPGTALSGGQQQMLAIGRSLMSAPKLIIFDEISLGLAPIVMDTLYETLRQLRSTGHTMLIIEQDVGRAISIADRACVLEHGRIALSGAASEIRSDARLRQLYLGEAK